MSRPIAPRHRSHPAFRSTSVTATAPGCDQPRACDGRQVVGTATGPAPLHHDRAGAGRGERGQDVGLPVRVADLDAPAARRAASVDPGATTASAGSPHGAAPIAMVPGRVDPHHPRAGQRRQRARHGHRARGALGHQPIRLRLPRRDLHVAAQTNRSSPAHRARPPRPAAPRRAGRTGPRRRARPGSPAPARPRCRRRCRAGRRRPRSSSTAASGMPRRGGGARPCRGRR